MPEKRKDSLSSLKDSVITIRKKFSLPKRYAVIMMCALANCISYTMRTNLNITIVAMVKGVENNTEYDTCPELMYNSSNNEIDHTTGDFDWSQSVQGIVLGAYYYGYIVSNVNGGQLCDWIGSRWLVGISLFVAGLLTLITPICAQWNVYAVVAVRVMTGLSQGLLTPGLITLLSYWIPRNEKSSALALIIVGGNFGTIITMPLCAYLVENGFAGGWPSVFYTFGTLGCLFSIPWFIQIRDAPEVHPNISKRELMLIKDNVEAKSSTKKRVPWISIFTSSQVWVITTAKFCFSWGHLFLMSKLPDYLENVLHLSIEFNGLVNALVFIIFMSSIMLCGLLSDLVERKQLLNRTVSRKVFETTSLIGAALFMAIVPLVGCDQISVIVLLLLGMAVQGLTSGGDNIIVLDIAPDYSGSIYGFSNAISCIAGILAPLFVGLVLDNDKSDLMSKWNLLFWVASGFYIFGALIFGIFISTKPLPWGKSITHTDNEFNDLENTNYDNENSDKLTDQSNNDVIRI